MTQEEEKRKKLEFSAIVRKISHKEPEEHEWRRMWRDYGFYFKYNPAKIAVVVEDFCLLKSQAHLYAKKRMPSPKEADELFRKHFDKNGNWIDQKQREAV